jgi:hypothetical protein
MMIYGQSLLRITPILFLKLPAEFLEQVFDFFMRLKYTQMHSKVGNLARKRRKFLCLERAPIVRAQGASKDQKFVAKLTLPKTNFGMHLCIV